MILSKNSLILVSLGLSLVLFSGCGSSTSMSDDNKSVEADKNHTNEQENTTEKNDDTNTSDDNKSVVAGYESKSGILIETKSDGTKLAWVNTTGSDCLIYRIADRGSNIADGGEVHCQSLASKKYAGIDGWRMPTVDEAVYAMAHVSTTGENKIIYPDDNPNCLFMATSDSKDSKGSKFVYTTNSMKVGNSGFFSDSSRTVAGIRCVANQ
jgi:hypothetical protein